MKNRLQTHTLDNGVIVLAEHLPAMHTVAMGCWLTAGSRHEATGRQGGFHFIEHMVFKGTRRRTARDIAIDVESVGGHMNAVTGKELTCYYAKALSENLPLLADVLTDMFFCSVFDPEEYAREQQVILEEIKSRDDTPEDFIFDQFLEDRCGRTGLGHSVLGYEDTVGGTDRDALYGMYRNAYRPERLIVSVAGNLDGQDACDVVRRALDGIQDLPGNNGAGPASGDTGDFRTDVRIYSRDIEQTHFVLGVTGIPYNHDDRYVYAVLDMLLSGGMSSRLFQEVREKRGLVYDIQSGSECYTDRGYFTISASTRPANLREVLEVTAGELKSLMCGEASADEVDRVKRQLRANMAMSFENVSGRMMKIARSRIYFGRQVPDEEILEQVSGVSLDDVQRAANTLFAPGRFAASILGPYPDDKHTSTVTDLVNEIFNSA